MFAIFYGLFTLFGKIGWNIEYGVDKYQAKEQAKRNNVDIYRDKKGVTHLVENDKPVILRSNLRGETYYTDNEGKLVKWCNKKENKELSNTTVRLCLDEFNNPIFWSGSKTHKNFQVSGYKYLDLTNNTYVALREIHIEDDWKKVGRHYGNYGRTHYFYINPITLEIVRESDGEKELRNRGWKKVVSKEVIDKFIIDYNKQLHKDYEPKDKGRCINSDISKDLIDKFIWKQNRKEMSINE